MERRPLHAGIRQLKAVSIPLTHREELRAGLQAEQSLSRVVDALLALARPAVRLQVSEKPLEPGVIPIRASKLGGLPDLPEVNRWPDATLDIPAPTPQLIALAPQFHLELPPPQNTLSLPFIAQIRLEELANLLPKNPFRQEGILYFFYNTATFVSDGALSPEEKARPCIQSGDIAISYHSYGWPASQNCRVLFCRDGAAPLRQQSFPDNLLPQYRYDELSVSFDTLTMLPGVETSFIGKVNDTNGSLRLTDEEWNCYSETLQELIPNVDHLLGYSQDAQPYALETSYHYFRSELFPELPDWDALSDEEQREEYLACCLLLQIEPHANRMYFGRAGALYFFIRNADLAQGDFSRVWAWIQ